jgi:hypothetical protein
MKTETLSLDRSHQRGMTLASGYVIAEKQRSTAVGADENPRVRSYLIRLFCRPRSHMLHGMRVEVRYHP